MDRERRHVIHLNISSEEYEIINAIFNRYSSVIYKSLSADEIAAIGEHTFNKMTLQPDKLVIEINSPDNEAH